MDLPQSATHSAPHQIPENPSCHLAGQARGGGCGHLVGEALAAGVLKVVRHVGEVSNAKIVGRVACAGEERRVVANVKWHPAGSTGARRRLAERVARNGLEAGMGGQVRRGEDGLAEAEQHRDVLSGGAGGRHEDVVVHNHAREDHGRRDEHVEAATDAHVSRHVISIVHLETALAHVGGHVACQDGVPGQGAAACARVQVESCRDALGVVALRRERVADNVDDGVVRQHEQVLP